MRMQNFTFNRLRKNYAEEEWILQRSHLTRYFRDSNYLLLFNSRRTRAGKAFVNARSSWWRHVPINSANIINKFTHSADESMMFRMLHRRRGRLTQSHATRRGNTHEKYTTNNYLTWTDYFI